MHWQGGNTHAMKNSLQHRLSVWLSAVIVACGVLAAGVSFWLAYDEAQEFQDNALRQIATLVDADRLTHSGQRYANAPDSDPETRIMVQRLTPLPEPGSVSLALPVNLPVGFHTLEVGGVRWRVYVRALKSGEHIAVAQEIQVRAEAARDSALRTLLPLIALIPLLLLLSRQLIRAGLAPVHALAQIVDAQQEDRPTPLPASSVPDEIIPFVQSINRLLERTNRLIAQQRRFIADAAHELRTPLTALSVQAQNLQQADSLETARQRLAPLLAGMERARHLTEQLLSLARTQAASAWDTKVDVPALARELIAEYLPLAEARHIDLGLEENASLFLHASPDALRLILRNGLENALNYTQEGGEVTLRLLTEDGDAVMEIVDNGPGIPLAERERAFDPFYRMPGTSGLGSGLGLAIAKEAATRQGGRVSLHDRAHGHGLVFRYRQRHGK